MDTSPRGGGVSSRNKGFKQIFGWNKGFKVIWPSLGIKGFKGWDLFSLLENSRIYFSRENNEKFIKYYYENTYPNLEFDHFRNQYYFLNTSRQTRLLGRWVKFSKIDKNNSYLKYIDTTTKRLKESLANLNIKALNNIYEKILN